MKRRRRRLQLPPEKKLELTPMIDVTFLLLIFFMLTIQFRDPEGVMRAALPRTEGVGGQPADPLVRVRVQVAVEEPGTRLELGSNAAWDGRGLYRYGSDRRLAYRVGPRWLADMQQVQRALASLREADPELKLVIAPAEGTVYADVVPVLDLARLLGYESISFTGAP